MKTNLSFAIILLVCLPFSNYAQDNAVDTTNLTPLAKMLLNHTYQFTATYVQPMSGRQKNVTGDNYTFKVDKDLVEADLPYFGKSTSAPIGTTDVGMKFTSKDFAYNSQTLTKSREQIIIKPKDVSDIQEIYLIVYPGGTADLRITSNSRQTISYQGNITALKPVK
ncbi:DUF4251 domain-containing protein [Panacibacter ginsenosidivorans]|uniref:DUF4251 domain-containing protein n=1 Tax=Panacibacter ginsenosidivorans TaxID=1813871 RepID=A0A5B8V7X1_9BACT|nr:DUF4251 domain-containing protein [Panacibacter ginsenosidivorans]QEC66806.1 DUF4251 domain-containing protein [Panacibacter ginsenosidivorans]